MRREHRWWLVPASVASFLVLAGFGVTRSGEEDPAVRLERAIQLETVDGDLGAAIAQYSQIIEGKGNDRAIVAKALLRLGGCHEKLGHAEARRAYQRLVDDYADQTEEVVLARARLAALTSPSPTTLTVRRLENPPEDAPAGAPSRDGRYLSFVDWRTGDLTIRDLRTGSDRRLTTEGTLGMDGPPVYQQAWESTWSPDSKEIAYLWYRTVRDRVQEAELRIVGVDGGKPRILSHLGNGEGGCADWSPDGKQILASLDQSKGDGSLRMLLVSTTNGSTRVLTTIKREVYPTTMRFSPDGRHVVYDALPDEGFPERDIVLLSLETGQTTPLVRHPADDFLLGWSADGQWLVFASDRAGALGLWVVRVTGEKTQGTPRLVKKGIGRIVPMGFTRQGTLFYGVVTATEDVYVADLDPKTGRVDGPARKAIEQNEGGNYDPSYSPDGKLLAYVTRGGNSPYPTNRGNALCIRSLETGQERVFYNEIWRLGYRWITEPEWSPDGRFITFTGSRGAYPVAVLRLALETGEIAPILEAGPDEVVWDGAYGHGETHFFARGGREAGVSTVVARDLETGQEREIYRFPALERRIRMSLSPDGRWLSLVNAFTRGAERSLRVIPVSGGEAREVWSFGGTQPGTSHTWSHDGRYILFTARDPDDPPLFVLWRVPVEGGTPEKLELERRWGIGSLTVHPSGRQIAMAGRGGPSTSSEVWIMENFLPE